MSTYRLFSSDDATRLSALDAECLPALPRLSPVDFVEFAKRPNNAVVVHDHAYAMFHNQPSKSRIVRIGVAMDARGHDVGRNLLRAYYATLEAYHQASGYTVGNALSWLLVPDATSWLGAQLWLRHVGYVAIGIRDGQIRFEKPLNELLRG